MLERFRKKLQFIKLVRHIDNNNSSLYSLPEEFVSDLEYNLDMLRRVTEPSIDFVVRRFSFGPKNQVEAALIFVDGLVNREMINENIIKPLMYDSKLTSSLPRHLNAKTLASTLLPMDSVKLTNKVNEVISSLYHGATVMLIQDETMALSIDTRGWQLRSIEEPQIEQAVRGAREAFTENLRTNTALVRRRIQDPHLIIEQMELGERTHTAVSVIYLQGITNPKLINEVKRRLKSINIDAVLESGYVEQFIEDAPFSPFSTVGNTERPDKIAASLLEGRVAILVDGTPFALTVPMLFIEGFQAVEDYYSRPYYVSLIRLLRFISFMIALLAPAVYVALISFHTELIPTSLVLSMAASAEGTPFPAVAEAIAMILLFEILREGGIRRPVAIGPTLTIVGALIIGDVAVSAGLVGAPMIIVVALTAVTSFMVVTHTDALTLLRLVLIILAGILGAFGVAIGLLAILVHLCSLRSFGVPYLSPFAPLVLSDLKDSFIRMPIWTMITRPRLMNKLDPQRESFRLDPDSKRAGS